MTGFVLRAALAVALTAAGVGVRLEEPSTTAFSVALIVAPPAWLGYMIFDLIRERRRARNDRAARTFD